MEKPYEEVPAETRSDGALVVDGPKVLRVVHMLESLNELPRGPLDEAAQTRLAGLEQELLVMLDGALPRELLAELKSLLGDVSGRNTDERRLRLLLAQLLGWVHGLLMSGPLVPVSPG